MDMLENPNKIVGIMAIVSLAGLAVFAGMGFFIDPKYKDIVSEATGVFKDVVLVAGGVKAGLSINKNANT